MAGATVFGEALAFYSREPPNGDEFVVYLPLVEQRMQYRRWQGKWGKTVEVARTSSIVALVGIWVGPSSQDVFILRKHPGLDLLNEAERGLTSGEASEEDSQGLNDTDGDS